MRERVGQKIKLKSVEEILGVVGEESAMEIEIYKIHPFKDHPFHVVDDDRMKRLVDSIRENGILVPAIVRSIGNDEYEMISGHRRMHAAQKLGMERIPVIIREMSDDEAIVKMVDSNIQREELLPTSSDLEESYRKVLPHNYKCRYCHGHLSEVPENDLLSPGKMVCPKCGEALEPEKIIMWD